MNLTIGSNMINPATCAIDSQLQWSGGGDLLYKFRSASKPHHLKALEDGTLWIPDTISLNDPFDSKPRVFLESDTEEERNRYRENVTGAGVLCFSGPFNGEQDELLRWSHYADGHMGFCLLIRDPALSAQARKVEYLDTYPNLAEVHATDARFWDRVGFFKAQCWRYEEERRVLFPGRARQEYKLPSGAIWGIVFGCWSRFDQRKEIARLVLKHSRGCKFFQARIRTDEFRLRYEFVTPEYSLPNGGRKADA